MCPLPGVLGCCGFGFGGAFGTRPSMSHLAPLNCGCWKLSGVVFPYAAFANAFQIIVG